jgi:hypothetical protein
VAQFRDATLEQSICPRALTDLGKVSDVLDDGHPVGRDLGAQQFEVGFVSP